MLPLTLLVLVLDGALRLFAGGGMPGGVLLKFIVGAAFVLAGMCFLFLGEELAMISMGEKIGAHLSGTGRYPLLIGASFVIGALVTLAEPNLAVFASLLPGIADKTIMIWAAVGVGLFMALDVVRIIRRVPLQVTLTFIFLLVFGVAAFAPYSSIPVSFDAGGVATGPLTVSFLMSVGLGLASVQGGRSESSRSFGTVAFCTAGPIVALLLLGILGKTGDIAAENAEAHSASALGSFAHLLPEFIEEVALALLPIVLLFVLFQLILLRLHRRSLMRIGMGVLYTFVGHALFLTGVCAGFLPAGAYLGEAFALLPNGLHVLLIPAAMLTGGFVVMAEPGVHALNAQVEEATVGAVPKKAMNAMICIGVMIADGLAMLRVLTGASLWYFLLGGYLLSLVLSFAAPKIFTAIAFDSGGVASGAMTVAFMLPFAKGACLALCPERTLTDAFGLIALVVIMPIITVQLLGLLYRLRLGHAALLMTGGDAEISIIEFDGEEEA